MKKVIILGVFLFLLVVFSTIGTLLITNGREVESEVDILSYQHNLGDNYSCYGYTIDNPKTILNPYGISPLTAIIMFETEDYLDIKVTIFSKDNNNLTYTSQKSKCHYLPIYGLYPDYENKIKLEYNNKEYIINITTGSLPEDLTILEYQKVTNDLYFETNSNYLYAYDRNNDIRWYYLDYMVGNITKLANNRFLISNNQITQDNSTTGIIEIDLLGKIYYEYLIKDNYYGYNTITEDNNILVLSSNLIELDKQNGNIISEINDYSDSLLVNNDIKLDKYNLYHNNEGVRFGALKKTDASDKNIVLINYKQLNNKYNIELNKEYNRLIIEGDFQDQEVYIILDKFFGKKIYKIDTNYFYINEIGLSSKYNIYLMIDNVLYKTNKYVVF